MCVGIVKGLDCIEDSDELYLGWWFGLSGPEIMEL